MKLVKNRRGAPNLLCRLRADLIMERRFVCAHSIRHRLWVTATILALVSPTYIERAFGRIEVIARTGDSVPEGNGLLDGFLEVTVNSAGHVAFGATLSDNPGGFSDYTGIYYWDGSNISTVVRQGHAAPNGDGQIATISQSWVLNNSGQIAYRVALVSSPAGSDNAIYLRDADTTIRIARTGDPVPGGNGQFAIFGVSAMNSAGQMAIEARLMNTAGGTVDDAAVYRYDGTAFHQIARESDPLPDGNGQFSDNLSNSNAQVNEANQVLFHGTGLGSTSQSSPHSAIYLHDGTTLRKIVRRLDNSPDGNGQLGSPTGLIDAAGRVVFTPIPGLLNTNGGSSDDTGVFLHNGTELVAIAREGDPRPEGDGFFGTIGTAHIVNGMVVFNAGLSSPNPLFGLYAYKDGVVSKVVRQGELPPEGHGEYFNPVMSGINAAGQIVFRDSLRNISGGLGNTGLYLTDGVERLKVLRSGEILDGNSVIEVTNAISAFPLGENGRYQGLNEFAQLAAGVRFADGTNGLYLFTPDVHWRAPTSGLWDIAANWTLSISPGNPHHVFIDPANSLEVSGPSGETTVKLLEVGGGTGTATLAFQPSSALTATDELTIAANGIVQMSAASNIGPNTGVLRFRGGILRFGASFDLSSDLSFFLEPEGGSMDTNGFNTFVSQAISGTGSLTKVGAGRLTLTGNNGYTGTTTISAGMLTVTNSSSLGAIPGGDVIIEDGGSLNVGGGIAGANTISFGQKVFRIAGDGGGQGRSPIAISLSTLPATPAPSTSSTRCSESCWMQMPRSAVRRQAPSATATAAGSTSAARRRTLPSSTSTVIRSRSLGLASLPS